MRSLVLRSFSTIDIADRVIFTGLPIRNHFIRYEKILIISKVRLVNLIYHNIFMKNEAMMKFTFMLNISMHASKHHYHSNTIVVHFISKISQSTPNSTRDY